MKTLIRLDLNIPIKQGSIKDISKIKSYSKSVQKLLKKHKLTVFTHLGRPTKQEPELSSKNLIPTLEKNWKCKIIFEKSYDSKKNPTKTRETQRKSNSTSRKYKIF